MIELAGRTFRRHGSSEWEMESVITPGAWTVVFGDNEKTIWEWRIIAQALEKLSTLEDVEKLFHALLQDYIEAVDHIGLSYFEERLQWWRELVTPENVEERT